MSFEEWQVGIKGLLEDFWAQEDVEDGEELVALSYFLSFQNDVYKVTYTREALTDAERYIFTKVDNEAEAIKYDKREI